MRRGIADGVVGSEIEESIWGWPLLIWSDVYDKQALLRSINFRHCLLYALLAIFMLKQRQHEQS